MLLEKQKSSSSFLSTILLTFVLTSCLYMPTPQVTEQARLSVEACLKEAQERHRTLEEKLQEAEKEKQDLEESKKKDLASLEEQV